MAVPMPVDRLVARTVMIDPEVATDLVAVAGDDGLLWDRAGTLPRGAVRFAGRGVALRIDLPQGMIDAGRVAAALGGIESDDDVGAPGCGPIAVGALPFDHRAPATLLVPELLVGQGSGGLAWMTTVAPAVSPAGRKRPSLEALAARPVQEAAPDSFQLRACRPHTEWCSLVDDALAEIEAGRFAKVVLAREVVVEGNRPVPVSVVTRRLRALYPSCMVFAFEGFVGASPELLVARTAAHVRSHPLAGTLARTGDPAADDARAAGLLTSEKDRREHRLVVETVAEGLRPVCRVLDVPDTPAILPLRNVVHLGTELTGQLGDDRPSALDLAVRLHPTPAVAGVPTEAALQWLARCEGLDRGRYAGPVGWVDAQGNGEWALGIRSAELDGATARLRAGAGVVAGSDPEDELAETQLKLQALLAALVRP